MAEVGSESGARTAGVWTARGPRAVEAWLLASVASLAAQTRRDPRLLTLPVRIVVPSRSLADHVGERLVAHARGSLAGVLVQTLHGLALEVLERAGVKTPDSDALFPVLVRRLAAEESLLRERLGPLVDGYAPVEATVADLLDAGFDEASAEAALEALEAADASETARAAALAVARVARRCLAEMERGGIGHRALLLRAAREALARDPETVLPARCVFVHGFADATGLRAELIEELVRHRHASVLVDEPPDPSQPGEPDAGGRFTQRLRDRMLLIAQEHAAEPAPTRGATLDCVEAARPDAEVREIAGRVRSALDAGVCPERIGVVARDLASFRAPLRRHFDRLGIPFSGAGSARVGSLTRHARALEELLREHATCRSERWLDAMAPGPDALAASDLRLGLRRLGLLRVAELAAHRFDGRSVKLPVVAGWWSDAVPEAGDAMRVERRRLRADSLASAIAAARATCARLDRLRAGRSSSEQIAELIEFVSIDLGWDRRCDEWKSVHAELEGLRRELPPDFRLTLTDLALLVRRHVVPRLAVPLGGCGAGVQVLDVTQARGRTFERLFVMGLARDSFPRSVREDPLFPDALRARVRDVLADVPVKTHGHDEERFLFAELVASAPHVTLSWPRESDEGRPCARSSFVERLRWAGVFEKPAAARSVLAPVSDGQLLSEEEHAMRAALFGPPGRLEIALPFAMRSLGHAILGNAGESAVASLAASRLAILSETEGSAFRGSPRLGPYFGFVGAARAASDPRAARLFVTTLERLSRCSWQTFLERLLRLEALPDAGGTLPGIDRRLLGSAVHRAIAGVFAERPSDAAPDPRAGGPLWPDDAQLADIALEAAAGILEDEGISLRGLARVLAQQVLPYVVRARSFDQAEREPIQIVAVEGERRIDVVDSRGRAQALFFRADRIEDIGERERLTDFKTGKPISDKKTEAARRRAFVAAVARGEILQPVAYARSTRAGGAGRLLYLRPELPHESAEFSALRGDAELDAPFDAALRGLFDAWQAGSFFPRMLGSDLDNEPTACQFCEVAEACLRGDTESRRRFAAWVESAEAAGEDELDGAERALLGLFRLGATSDAEAEAAP